MAVCEWTGVHNAGGTFELRCPDLRIRAFIFFINADIDIDIVKNICGGLENLEKFNETGFSYGLMKKRCRDVESDRSEEYLKDINGSP